MHMNFFKTFLASLLALIVCFGLMSMLWALILVGMLASLGSTAPSVSNNSVLRLDMGTITDAPASSPLDKFDFISMTTTSRTTLLSALSAIKAAAEDHRIKGIYINFDENTSVSLSSLEEIRAELVKFKESGKFIVAYNENYGQTGYYLSSVADKIYMNPEGDFAWRGISLHTMFYKGLLDKLDIEPMIFRHGTFKSAVEPYMYDRMSYENRLQYQTLANSIWGMVVDAVSKSRNIPEQSLQEWASSLAIDSPGAAFANGLVDGLRYEDQVMSELNTMIGHWSREESAASENGEVESVGENGKSAVPEGEAPEVEMKNDDYTVISDSVRYNTETEVWESLETLAGNASEEMGAETEAGTMAVSGKKSKRGGESDPNIVSFGDYVAHASARGESVSKNKIAIIYAEGSIVSGQGGSGQIGSAAMLKRLSKVRRDPNVKAVVFRVNSPGGSALASEVMWRELQLLKQEVPVIVSMGEYAASGGYYISTPADVIYADKSTLTGSIGVFGMYANIGRTLKNKLGVTIDGVNTNTYSDHGSMFRDMSPAERAYVQKSIEAIYKTFVGHVADGRNMTFEEVDKIGQGRVWTGVDALNIGLVDGHGGIFDAITIAADRAGISDDFRIWEVAETPTGLAALLGGISESVRSAVLRDEMGEMFIHYNRLKEMLDEQGVQARMPYIMEIQ